MRASLQTCCVSIGKSLAFPVPDRLRKSYSFAFSSTVHITRECTVQSNKTRLQSHECINKNPWVDGTKQPYKDNTV